MADCLQLLQKMPVAPGPVLTVTNALQHVVGVVSVDRLLVSPVRALGELATPALVAEIFQAQPVVAVQCLADRDEIADLFECHQLIDLPVIDLDQRLMGIIYHNRLV